MNSLRKIALVGGGEFRPGCEVMDRAILDATGADRPSVVVVPTAAAAQRPDKAASNGVAYFNSLGAQAKPLMVLDSEDANDAALVSEVDSADLTYLTGGSPSHLLEVLRGSLFLDTLVESLERGAVVAGSSAGAMVLGEWMWYKGWDEALGLVPGIVILPHHESAEPDSVSRELDGSAPTGAVVLGIDARTGVLAGPEGWTVLGTGGVTVYTGREWQRFAAGNTMPKYLSS
ncbi:MAG: Type 1 glutamine amidotransferase-like domain-containing protein [Chloroflexi bacterium]|nr:Type 1 glutamine amidotransferase-like domain-containing protein [Chloroflexota bacterium]